MDLKEIYEKFNYPGGDKLYKLAKKEGLKITHTDVDTFLQKQHVAQVFKRTPPKKGFIVAFNPNERAQMDLIDMSKFGQTNKGYNWIFLIVDIFTRKAWAYLMKNKNEGSINDVLKQYLGKYQPDLIVSDNESGFKSRIVQKLMEAHQVAHDMVEPQDHKALGVVDRAVQTIKNAIYKYLKAKNTTSYVSQLPRIVEAYNATPHSGIENIAPNDASAKENVEMLQLLNHKKYQVNRKNHVLLQVGDIVRIRLKTNAFARSFDDKYSDKQYTIEEIEDRTALLDNGQHVSLRRLVKVPSTGPMRERDVLSEAKQSSKIKKRIRREHLETSNKEFQTEVRTEVPRTQRVTRSTAPVGRVLRSRK
jgi:hypothetical protein